MLHAQTFIDILEENGIGFFSGVPCSLLKHPMSLLEKRSDYVGATIESEAISLAAGAWLAGRNTAVFCQNSGLGNLVNPLSSLNLPFRIPSLIVLGWRGAPGFADEPQHEVMGRTTRSILDLMGVESFELPPTTSAMRQTVRAATHHMDRSGKCVALLVRPETFESLPTNKEIARVQTASIRPNVSKLGSSKSDRGTNSPSRYDALSALTSIMPEPAVVIATTGKCGRELYSLADRNQHFYMVGSMGSASAIGLGLALNQSKRPVVVLDGDGAALMRLGTMATAGRTHPRNFIHIVLDNAAHDSTGGQPTGSESVDFGTIALSCGYASATNCHDISALKAAFRVALKTDGPHLIHMQIARGSLRNLGRPKISPEEVAARLRSFLTS